MLKESKCGHQTVMVKKQVNLKHVSEHQLQKTHHFKQKLQPSKSVVFTTECGDIQIQTHMYSTGIYRVLIVTQQTRERGRE